VTDVGKRKLWWEIRTLRKNTFKKFEQSKLSAGLKYRDKF